MTVTMLLQKALFLWCFASTVVQATEESDEDVFFAKGKQQEQAEQTVNQALLDGATQPTGGGGGGVLGSMLDPYTIATSHFRIEYKGMKPTTVTQTGPSTNEVQAVHDATEAFAQDFWALQASGLSAATTETKATSESVNSHGIYTVDYETTLHFPSSHAASATSLTQADLDHLLTTQWKNKLYYQHVVATLEGQTAQKNNPFLDCHQMILTSLSREETAVRRLSIVVILAIVVVAAIPVGVALILAANICAVPIWCCYFTAQYISDNDGSNTKQGSPGEKDGFLKDQDDDAFGDEEPTDEYKDEGDEEEMSFANNSNSIV